MMFWLIAGAMTLLTLLVITLPLLRSRRASSTNRRNQNIAVYRHRLEELESDAAAGIISKDELAGARDELLSRLPQDLTEGAAPAYQHPAGRRRCWAGLALIALIPLLGVGLYLGGGGLDRLQTSRETPKLKTLGAHLAQEMRAHPQDPRGWFLLGRVRMTLGRYSQAADAFARANAHSAKPSAQLLTARAQALGIAKGGDFRGKPRKLFERALKVNPTNPKALWFSGVAAEQAHDPELALSHWSHIHPAQLPQDARSVLAERMAKARQAAKASETAFKLPLRVSIAPKLKSKVKAKQRVFIYARAVRGFGSKRPLAVAKRRVRDLPLNLDLTDAMGMTGGPALSSKRRWVVVARVSSNGKPEPRPGDFYTKRTVERAKLSRRVQLRISQRIR